MDIQSPSAVGMKTLTLTGKISFHGNNFNPTHSNPCAGFQNATRRGRRSAYGRTAGY